MSKSITKQWALPRLPKGLAPASNGAWVIATAEIDPSLERGGDVVRVKGMTTPDRLPLLAQHIHHAPDGSPTILGSVVEFVDTEVDYGGRMVPAKLARFEWADTDLSRKYQKLWPEHINTVSIGAMVRDSKPLGKDHPGGVDYTETDLYELSIVTVPANPAAQALRAIKDVLGEEVDLGPEDGDDDEETEDDEIEVMLSALDSLFDSIQKLRDEQGQIKEQIIRRIDDFEDTYVTKADSTRTPRDRQAGNPEADDARRLAAALEAAISKLSNRKP